MKADMLEGPERGWTAPAPIVLVSRDAELESRLTEAAGSRAIIRRCETGLEALELTGRIDLAAVLVDEQFEGEETMILAPELEKVASRRNIPLAVISSGFSKGRIEAYKQTGVERFLLKNMSKDLLIDRLLPEARLSAARHVA